AFGCDYVRLPGMEGSGAADRGRHRTNDPTEARDLRSRAADARRDEVEDLGIRLGNHREYGGDGGPIDGLMRAPLNAGNASQVSNISSGDKENAQESNGRRRRICRFNHSATDSRR